MIWANVPPISHDQALARQLRLEVPQLNIHTTIPRSTSRTDSSAGVGAADDRPLTACVEVEEWLNSPVLEVVCR